MYGHLVAIDSDELDELRADSKLAKDFCTAFTGVKDLEGLDKAFEQLQLALSDYAAKSVVREAAKKARATC